MSQFEANFADYGFKQDRVLSQRFNTYLYTFDQTRVADEMLILYHVRKDSRVKSAQFNYFITHNELLPDDELFSEQWHHKNTGQNTPGSGEGSINADIQTPLAWGHIYSYPNRNSRDIVIAVIDGGFDLEHPDINWWKNEAEIPDNGIDDDGNGYIDDYHGWNTLTKPHSGNISNGRHGTHVSGIIGAFGDNQIGISGVCWDVKIMPINTISGYVDQVIAAINYVIEQRVRYNETGGKKGAYIVASNSSFGANNLSPYTWPVLGEMYNQMGKVGILSTISAGNNNVNVDLQGNMPVGYPSAYTIGVASVTNRDSKSNFSAFGRKSVHIGAPGSGILSTLPLEFNFQYNDHLYKGYGFESGTSMSSPMVAGVIGLMYKAADEDMLTYYDSKPELLPLIFKQYILEGVDKISSLENITITGGRLNALKPILSVLEHTPKNVTALPQILPTTNIFFEPVSVTLTSATENAEIRYTLDGTTPTENSTLYIEPFLVSQNTRIEARAFAVDHEPSSVNTVIYEFMPNLKHIYPATSMNLRPNGANVDISWDRAGVTLTHTHTPSSDDSFGSETAVEFTVAHRFTDRDFIVRDNTNEVYLNMVGGQLYQVQFSSYDDNAVFTLKIWTGGNIDPINPGQLIHTQYVGYVPSGNIRTVILDRQVLVEPNKELWIGYTVSTPGGFPAGVSYDYSHDGISNLIYWEGKWTTLRQIEPTRHDSWYMTALVTIPDIPTATSRMAGFVGFQVSRKLINAGYDQPWTHLTPTPIYELYFTDIAPIRNDYQYRVTAVYDDQTALYRDAFFFRYHLPIISFPWSYGFDDTIEFYNGWDNPANRFFIDDHENGNNWNIASHQSGFTGGLHIMSPYSNRQPDLKNSWLISPHFILPKISVNDKILLKYLERNGDAQKPDPKYTFMISTTDNTPSSFFKISEHTITKTDWSEKIIDISEFAEQGIYFAIIHHIDPENPSEIRLDDFSISDSSVSEHDTIADFPKTALLANYPNPFNPTTGIRFRIKHPLSSGEGNQHIRIDIFNIKGQKVRSLVDDFYPVGEYEVIWNGRDEYGAEMGSGVYFYRMISTGHIQTRKMVLIK